jgi:hypothetical protein
MLRVEIVITGHASPRWRTAPNPAAALAQNKALSERRAEAVRKALVSAVKHSLANRGQIEFDISYPDPFASSKAVTVGSASRGSSDALAAGAKSDDNSVFYRRVDISLRIHQKTEVDAGRSVRKTLPSATCFWAIALTQLVNGGFGLGGVRAEFMLRNRGVDLTRNMKAWVFGAHTPSLGGGGAANRGQEKWVWITTAKAVDWAAFDGARVAIDHAGLGYFADIISKTQLRLPTFGVRGDITGWSTVSTPGLEAFSLAGNLEYQSKSVPTKVVTVQESDWVPQVDTSPHYLPIHFATESSALTTNDVAAMSDLIELARKELDEKTAASVLKGVRR